MPHLLAALPPLTTPSATDLVGLLPILILTGAFLLLMLLDLVTPASARGLLAVVTVLALAAAGGATIWGWFDAEHGHTLYFGSYSYDRFATFVNGIVIVSALLTVLISPGYLNRRGIHYGEYYALILAATVGMMLLSGAASLMVIFLAIELLSIALYILSGFASTEERSQESALKYLLLGGFASGFLLYGMALIYGETGHVQLDLIKRSLAASAAAAPGVTSSTDTLLIVGIVLLFVGFAFKVSAAPFHWWTPDVYQGAPTSVTTFMSVATKVAAFAALIRVYTATLSDFSDKWTGLISFVAIVSMFIGNVAALTQTSVKRMLAYSGVAQAGYMLIGVAVTPNPLGTVATLYYLAAYAITNLGAFAVITVMAGRGEDLDSYDNLRGLAYRRPYVAALMGLFLLSLGGFPMTAGFFGKLLVFTAAIKAQSVPLALWGIATSAISVFYYLRVVLYMYSRPREGEPAYEWARTSVAGASTLLLAGAGTVALGTVLVPALYSVAVSAQHGLIPGVPPG